MCRKGGAICPVAAEDWKVLAEHDHKRKAPCKGIDVCLQASQRAAILQDWPIYELTEKSPRLCFIKHLTK
ncbi:mCG147918 [Mus musculus]|nr:mCG147918 [Mus musculus]